LREQSEQLTAENVHLNEFKERTVQLLDASQRDLDAAQRTADTLLQQKQVLGCL
jgi:hypothetical protein